MAVLILGKDPKSRNKQGGIMLNVGLIGCGNISGIYLKNSVSLFSRQFKITACADARPEAAEACAKNNGFKALSVDALLADPEISVVLNLTTPQSHAEINLRALQAGKHVYCEKPFALDRKSAQEVLRAAERNKLRIGCAPDTFLGGGHQQCRRLVDSGLIGKVVSGTAFMLCHGHESWHPAPGFYYKKGGGPLFDMGPYYITALVNILGPVQNVCAMANRSTDLRKGWKANDGKTFPVEIDTHVSAVLRFASGAIVTLITSFDVWKHSNYCDIELHGTEGSLHEPDPNCFDGDARFFKAELSADWGKCDNIYGYRDNSRGLGLADMAAAIEGNRPHRVTGELAYHVLDVMCAIGESASSGKTVDIQSTCVRPEPLASGLKAGEIR